MKIATRAMITIPRTPAATMRSYVPRRGAARHLALPAADLQAEGFVLSRFRARASPLKNVSLTTFLYVSPVQMPPLWDHTGVPGLVGFTHFHSSTTSGSAPLMISRTLLSVSARQSPSSLIRSSSSFEAFISLSVIWIPEERQILQTPSGN